MGLRHTSAPAPFDPPMGLSVEQLALSVGVDGADVSDVVYERRPLTPEMAKPLARRFGTTSEFWINMQARYEADVAADISEQQITSRSSWMTKESNAGEAASRVHADEIRQSSKIN